MGNAMSERKQCPICKTICKTLFKPFNYQQLYRSPDCRSKAAIEMQKERRLKTFLEKCVDV